MNKTKFIFNILGKLEADDAPLHLVYHYFGQMYNKFENDPIIQVKVLARWDFLSTESTSLSYMFTPKYAAEGFYIDNDNLTNIKHAKDMVDLRFPGFGVKAEDEAARYISKMSALTGPEKESIFKLDATCYWNIIGRKDFPTLFLLAKRVNGMVCSSAASERVWSIYRFIHTRLRNKLGNVKVEKLVFIYVNCAIFDKIDPADYIWEDDGISLSWNDYEEVED